MFGRVKNFIFSKVDYVYRWVITHAMVNAMQENNERNKVITCDFILEADTSPQDEFALFQYLYEQKNEHFIPYYIINEHCAAYPEIKEKYGDNIIPYSAENLVKFSFRLRDLMKTTKFICGGFQVLHALNIGITDAVKRSPYVYSFFTQHGVNFFKDDFISQASYSSFLFDKIMISNEFERNLFIERGCYEEKNLVKNGLFRWDLLSADNATSQKSIFIYFTHRRYLRNIEDIQDTVYVRTILSLLRNHEFNRLIEENGYTVKVALHHTVLQVCGPDILEGIEILTDEEIADAKKNSALLITDYSSMCFEMWFQHKPVIFLNIPDAEDCIAHHHKTDLPTPYLGKEDYIFNVVDSVEECVDMLGGYFKNNFAFSAEEKKKRDRFFYYNNNFRERFYQYLISTKNDTKTLYHMPVGTFVDFARYPDLNTYAIEMPKPDGRWIVRKKGHFSFFVPDNTKDLAIQVQFRPYLRYKQYHFFAKTYLNGKKMDYREVYNRGLKTVYMDVPKSMIPRDGKIEISFKVSKVFKRKELKVAPHDNRYLAIRLISMDVLARDYSFETAEEQLRALNEQRALARQEALLAAEFAEEPEPNLEPQVNHGDQ